VEEGLIKADPAIRTADMELLLAHVAQAIRQFSRILLLPIFILISSIQMSAEF
jgi:hypothetical protein